MDEERQTRGHGVWRLATSTAARAARRAGTSINADKVLKGFTGRRLWPFGRPRAPPLLMACANSTRTSTNASSSGGRRRGAHTGRRRRPRAPSHYGVAGGGAAGGGYS